MEQQHSKSEKKRRAKDIEQLVNELAALPLREIEKLPCAREVQEEIAAGKDLQGGARKRQLKYAAKLLRDRPVQELFDYLARQKGSRLKEKREFHQLEELRNRLIDEALQYYEAERFSNGYGNEPESLDFPKDSAAMETIRSQLPEADRSALRKTAMQFAATRNRKFSRELFRLLQAAREKAQFSAKQE